MTTSIYMKVTPNGASTFIKGGSTERAHADWFDVGSFSAGLEEQVTFTNSNPLVAKPVMAPIELSVSQQPGLAELWALPLQGKASTIVVEIWASGQTPRRMFSYEFTNAYFTKIQTLEDVTYAGDVWNLEFRYVAIALNQYMFAPANGTATPTSTRRVTYNVSTAVTGIS